MTGAMCDDNRFELIEKYKNKLIDGTNIETAKDEMAVIENILFRFWQMGWLDKLEEQDRQKAEIEENGLKIETQANIIKILENALENKQAEIERLTETGWKFDKIIWKQKEDIKTAKSEAIKEFAERYRKEIFSITHFNSYVNSDLVLGIFNDLVKEMVGE